MRRRAWQRLVLNWRLVSSDLGRRLRWPGDAATLSGNRPVLLLDRHIDLAVADHRRSGSLRPFAMGGTVDDHLILALQVERSSPR